MKDQKDILLAKGRYNQRIFYEGILEASKKVTIFVLNAMTALLTPEEITNCLLDQEPGSVSFLETFAEKRSLEILNIVWDFIEKTLSPNQQRTVFTKRFKDVNNIISSCLRNDDIKVTRRVFSIARTLLPSKTEFRDFLRVGQEKGSNLLLNTSR